jgi:hydrogenase expression/formation protein HypC
MCLALPGKILAINHDSGLPMADVDFSGVRKSVCLAYTSEAKVGEYVIVHVGFAITILNEKEALRTLDLFGTGET